MRRLRVGPPGAATVIVSFADAGNEELLMPMPRGRRMRIRVRQTRTVAAPPANVAPAFTQATAVLNDRTLTITLVATGAPAPTYAATLMSGQTSLPLEVVAPGIFRHTFAASFDVTPYVATGTASNGVLPAATFSASGEVPAVEQPPAGAKFVVSGRDIIITRSDFVPSHDFAVTGGDNIVMEAT